MEAGDSGWAVGATRIGALDWIRPMTGLSHALIDWIEAIAPGSLRQDGSLVVAAGADSSELLPLGNDLWQVGFRDRNVLRTAMTGTRTYAERFFVWFTAQAAPRPRRNGWYQGLTAPTSVAAAGPLRVRPMEGRGVEVLADGEVVARFDHAGDAYAFSHYGFLPLELLIEQIAGPDEDLIFPVGFRQRSASEQHADARRIRAGAERLLAGTVADSSDRIVRVDEARRRLQVFRYVHALPKDGGGDSLQIAFLVADERAGIELRSMLRLDCPAGLGGVQHPADDPFRGAVVAVDLVSSAITPTADTLHAWLVRVRLWNETGRNADLYEVTANLVDRAVEIETRLAALGLDRHPREIGLLGFDRG